MNSWATRATVRARSAAESSSRSPSALVPPDPGAPRRRDGTGGPLLLRLAGRLLKDVGLTARTLSATTTTPDRARAMRRAGPRRTRITRRDPSPAGVRRATPATLGGTPA